MKQNGEQAAFANAGSDQGPGSMGLTKREYFAAMAMSGALANAFWSKQHSKHVMSGNTKTTIESDVAEMAIRIADELLKQLESKL